MIVHKESKHNASIGNIYHLMAHQTPNYSRKDFKMTKNNGGNANLI